MNGNNNSTEFGKEEAPEDLYTNVDPYFRHYFIERDILRKKIRSLKYNPYKAKREKSKLLFATIATLGIFLPILLMYLHFDKKTRKEYEEYKERLRQLGEEYKDEYSKKNSGYEGSYYNDANLSPGDLGHDYARRNCDFDNESYDDGDFGGWDDGGYDGGDGGGYDGGYDGGDGGGYDGGGDGGDGGD